MALLFLSMCAPRARAAAPPASPFAAMGDVQGATLANGTRLWIEEDHRAPLVAIQSCFEVGTADDPVAQPGLAQTAGRLLEWGVTPHLDGAARVDTSIALGGMLQRAKVTTMAERTCLQLVVPPSSLELALYSERDRLSSLAEGLTRDGLGKATWVSSDSAPAAGVTAVVVGRLRAALYEPGHPYGRLTPDDGAGVKSVGVEQMRQWLRQHYAGGPSSVVVVGDVSAARARELLAKYLGELAGPFPRPARPAPRVEPRGERRVVFDADVGQPTIALGWPTPKLFDDDDLALDVAVHVLVTRFLDHLMARDHVVTGFQLNENSLGSGGLFSVITRPAPGHGEDDCVHAVEAELAALAAAPPSRDELVGAQQVILERLASELDGDAARARMIETYAQRMGDPRGILSYAARYQALTAADVSRVTGKYLVTPQRVRLLVHPDPKAPKIGRLAGAAAAVAPPAVIPPPLQVVAPPRWAREPPPFVDAPAGPSFAPPRPTELVLRDGTRVVLVERHDVPSVTASVVVRWQHPFSGVTIGDCMNHLLLAAKPPGSERDLELLLKSAGATVSTETSLDATTLTFSVHPDRLGDALGATLAALEGGKLTQAQTELARAPFVGASAHWKPMVVAQVWSRHLLAPRGHRYATPTDGGEAEVAHLTAAEVSRYLAQEIRGDAVTVAVAGDVTAAHLAQLVGAKPAPPRASTKPAAFAWNKGTFLVPRAGADGVTIIATFPEPPHDSAELVAANTLETVAFDHFDELLISHGVRNWSELAWSSWALRDGPSFSVKAHVPKSKAAAFVKAALDAFEAKRAKPAVAADLVPLQRQWAFGLATSYDSASQTTQRLAVAAQSNSPADADVLRHERQEKLTVKQLADVATKYFRPEDLRVVVIGDVDGIQEGLSTLPIAPATVVSEPVAGGTP